MVKLEDIILIRHSNFVAYKLIDDRIWWKLSLSRTFELDTWQLERFWNKENEIYWKNAIYAKYFDSVLEEIYK